MESFKRMKTEDLARTLKSIEATQEQLEKDGHMREAIEYLERGLEIKKSLFGSKSKDTIVTTLKLAVDCNTLSVALLSKNKYEDSSVYLYRALELTDPEGNCGRKNDDRILARALTYNNFSCLYRRQKKLKKALKYAEKALKLETKLGNNLRSASTHLNLCAILSQLGRHFDARSQADSAIEALEGEFFNEVMESAEKEVENIIVDKVAVLAISHHNRGVENEYLGKMFEALRDYEQGFELAYRHLGPNHSVTQTLEDSLVEASKEVNKKRVTISNFSKKPSAQQQQQKKKKVQKRPSSAPVHDPLRDVKAQYSPKSLSSRSGGKKRAGSASGHRSKQFMSQSMHNIPTRKKSPLRKVHTEGAEREQDGRSSPSILMKQGEVLRKNKTVEIADAPLFERVLDPESLISPRHHHGQSLHRREISKEEFQPELGQLVEDEDMMEALTENYIQEEGHLFDSEDQERIEISDGEVEVDGGKDGLEEEFERPRLIPKDSMITMRLTDSPVSAEDIVQKFVRKCLRRTLGNYLVDKVALPNVARDLTKKVMKKSVEQSIQQSGEQSSPLKSVKFVLNPGSPPEEPRNKSGVEKFANLFVSKAISVTVDELLKRK